MNGLRWTQNQRSHYHRRPMLRALVLGSMLSQGLAPTAVGGDEATRRDGESEAEAEADAALEAERARARLSAALVAAQREARTGVDALADALAGLPDLAPTIADDPALLADRARAQLALAFTLLLLHEHAAAERAMDEALSQANGAPLPMAEFSDDEFARFHDQRLTALRGRGRGSVIVECARPCRVYIDEQHGEARGTSLLLGIHRVWIEAVDGRGPPLRRTITLDADGEVLRLRYAPLIPEPPEPTVDPEPSPAPIFEVPPPAPARPARALPRWAEITGLVAGAGLITAGALLVALDGDCPNFADPAAPDGCRRIWSTSPPAGFVLMGVGAGLGITGAVMLTVDEVRVGGGRSARQVGLRWTLRF